MKVKVKKTRGTTGNQHNYGLVTGSIWNYEDKPTVNTLSTTLKPVDRDEANIEAEKNETIVYPDKDGMLAHSKIGGKRHRQGGTPLNVPDGSFVFSDFRGMNIKNKELLKNIFNMNTNKAVTPADIAKRYEINQYKQILQDPWADPMDKKTAQLMIENNMRKLGQLALIQEGMKGFPDGIPDIALPLMGSDIAQGQQIPQQEEQPQQPPQAQKGKQVRSSTMTKSQADALKSMRMQKAIEDGYGNMTVAEFNNMYKPGYSGEIKITDEPGWFDNTMLAVTNPFATLMSIGDHSGNSWQSYVKEHNHNPIDMALNGALAAYTLAPSYFAKTPALLQTASQLKNINNMRNMAALYEMLGLNNNPVYTAPPKQMGGLTRAQTGVQIPGTVTNPVDSTKVVVNGAPQSGSNAAWDFVKNHKTFFVPATFETLYQGAKYLSPEFKRLSEWIAKLPIKQRLGKIAQLTKKVAFENPFGRLALYGGIDYALNYFFGDASEEEKAEAKMTLEQAAAQEKAKQDSLAGRTPDAYTGAGTNIYTFNPNQRSVVLDTPTVVTKPDTTTTVRIVPTVKDTGKVTNSTTLQKNKSSNSSGSTSSQSSSNSGAYVKKGDPSSYAGTYNRSKDSVVVKKQIGGSMRRYQGGGGFDVERAEGAKRADALGFYMKRPAYFDYTSEVGQQNPSTGDYIRQDGVIIPAVKDKSGKKTAAPWSYTDPKTGQTTTYKGVDDIVSFADPYINFKNYRAGEDVGEDEMGVDAWKKDLASKDDAIRRRAGDWYVSKLNEYNANILGDPTYETIVTKNPDGSEKKGYWEIGTNNAQQGFFEPYVKKEIEEKKDDKKEKKESDTNSGQAEHPVYEQGISGSPWWNYDVVNYANQLGNYFDIEPGNLPVYQQYSPYIPDPTFLDPARAIAQQQGLVRQASDAIMSGADPTVGRANVIAAAANSANPVADIMAKYDQANVGIANEYGRNAAQMMNQAMLQNNQYNKTYTDELEVRRQQYQNALREGRTDVAKSIMQGMKNAAETSWMNATSDSYAVDPSTGNVYFKRGFDPKTGKYRSSGSSERDTEYIDYLVKTKGWDRKDAIRYVTGKKSKKDDDAQLGGMLYNPMDVIWNY